MQTPQTAEHAFDNLLTDMQNLPLFSGLGREQLQCLEGTELIEVAPGEVIVRQGEVVGCCGGIV